MYINIMSWRYSADPLMATQKYFYPALVIVLLHCNLLVTLIMIICFFRYT